MGDVGTFPDKPFPADNDKVVLASTADSDAARRIDVSALRRWGYGTIYVAGAAGQQTLTGPGVWDVVNQFDSNGPALGTAPDHPTDVITIEEAGIWRVMFTTTCEWVTAAAALDLRIFLGGVETQIRAKQALALAPAQSFTATAGGILNVGAVPVALDLRAESSLAANALRVVNGAIVLDRVGV